MQEMTMDMTMTQEEINGKDKKIIFATLINSEHQFAENQFVRGKLLGYAEVLCEHDRKRIPHYVRDKEDNRVLLTRCTKEEYAKLIDMIEVYYSGLCTYHYDLKKVMKFKKKEQKQEKAEEK